MWNHQYLSRLDFRTIPILLALMWISLLVISATTCEVGDAGHESFFTPMTKTQIKWFAIGWVVYLFFAGFDYRKIRQWTWLLYIAMILMLIGLFFVAPIQNVHRWYRIPFLGSFQPSEYAKLIVVITLSWFLEKKMNEKRPRFSTIQAIGIVMIPFLLILKQPDLGTALVLYPIALVMFYFGGIKRKVLVSMAVMGISGVIFVILLFLGIISHEELRPYATKVLKEYQYERLNPNTYHQKAAQTALALGGFSGSGWRKSEFTGRQWLPAPYTDSVFAAFGEEFGLIGVFLLLLFFFGLIYFSFQVTAVANDRFGRLLSAGITVYLAMHVIVNMGMMCGFLPITGVPLILVTYGGSSVLATMTALGILQSIYSRRYMF
ncbi:MAG TPA: FtsW/RodA/SpoVE family cell cycle protein [Rhabdochlamydiaceae bacterium]|nr:FtsW/RodA/SpoVE family cell cycle protein [Rhabdochlamydiaceae bacterium]